MKNIILINLVVLSSVLSQKANANGWDDIIKIMKIAKIQFAYCENKENLTSIELSARWGILNPKAENNQFELQKSEVVYKMLSEDLTGYISSAANFNNEKQVNEFGKVILSKADNSEGHFLTAPVKLGIANRIVLNLDKKTITLLKSKKTSSTIVEEFENCKFKIETAN